MATITPTDPATSPADPTWIPSPLYRWTLEQYEAMVDAGFFHEHDRLHLINGYLVAKMTQNDAHCTADDLCGAELRRVIPPGWYVRAAKPIRIPSQQSKPEPDRCVVRGTIRDYSRRSPEPAQIALVVEISDSSLGEDRKRASVYAGGGIPLYWIVNLVDRQVEVYTGPSPGGYASRVDFKPGQQVSVVVDGREVGQIGVNDLLP
jgi:Uma2 family endonuclease